MTPLAIAGALVSVVSLSALMAAVMMLAKTQRVRRRHGIPHTPFFPMGSGLVFGTLALGLALGLALEIWAQR